MSEVDIKKLPNWLIWKLEKRAGKPTKVPYSYANTSASSVEPSTWTTFEKAQSAKERYEATGIGFAFPLDKTIVGIDIDHCVEDGIIQNPSFLLLVEQANTYTELSPSGTGIHMFFHVPDGFSFEKNRSKKCPGFECYSSGRYFTYTDNPYGERKDIRTMSQTEMNELLKTVGYPWTDVQLSGKSYSLELGEQEILDRMFNASNGDKVRKLYNGDIGEYNDDHSSADMALCMHFAFWTQKDATKIEKLWIESPLGQRSKTQDRKDYRERTIQYAITATKDVYSPTSKDAIVKNFNLMVDKKGTPFLNLANTMRILEHDPLLSSSIRRNAFSEENETNMGTKYNDARSWRPISSGDEMYVLRHIQENYPFFEKIPKATVQDAITLYAHEHEVNELIDWLSKLEWDGEHRLDSWLHKAYGTENDEYHASVGSNWMKSLVKRIVEPGCKVDHMLVLEGAQGMGKSHSLTVLGRGYHTETVLDPNNKDFFMLLKRNIIVELSEGYTMSRSDSRLLKSVITNQEDSYRVPYERYMGRFKRRCVFAMTTNEDQYLRDETGNRRFLPVHVERQADIEWIEHNIEQMYAEAYKRAIEDKETYWEFPKDEMESRQMSRMVDNPYSDALITWYANMPIEHRLLGITALEAYIDVWQGGTSGREMSIGHAMQVTSQFSNVLFLHKKKSMVNGKLANRWFPSSKTEELIEMAMVPSQPLLAEFENI